MSRIKGSTLRVYNSSNYSYIRFVVIAAPFLCFWLAYSTGASWLYGIGIIMAIITGYVLSLLSAKTIFTSAGITLIKNFQRTHILWDDVIFADELTLRPYGFSLPIEIICFSTKKQNLKAIEKCKILPPLSQDFIFVILDHQARWIITESVPSNVMMRLKVNLCPTDKTKPDFISCRYGNWIFMCGIYVVVLLLAYYLIQL